MAFIGNKEKNFRKYLLNHFGIALPPGVRIFFHHGVRAGNSDIIKSDIKGEKGYAACDPGFNPTNSFIQNFGHLATKNFVEVDAPKAREFALGRGLGKMALGQRSMWIAVRHKGFTVGMGYYDAKDGKLKNHIPKKRCRNMVNTL
ncbi:MAG: hypothetical protein AB1295_04170 [Candidatus Micrarchaeota archaeon]